MEDFAAKYKGKIYSPREYLDKQLNMTDEEKADRKKFFTELFAQHELRTK